MQRMFKPEHAMDGSRSVMYAATDSYAAVKLPYKGCSISAVAVLPSEELAANGIAAAAAQLDMQQLLAPSSYRRVPMQGLQLELPRFKAATQCVSLKQVRRWQRSMRPPELSCARCACVLACLQATGLRTCVYAHRAPCLLHVPMLHRCLSARRLPVRACARSSCAWACRPRLMLAPQTSAA